ncbi:MAG TPA: mechanosensitive ion channel, partial [Bacteroidia bacterium]|nr:mechanosensitive ion channel [Bacteroidia bacterium]
LKRLGVDTTSLVTLVGAAGLAIGFALQSSLQNFTAGFMLIIFKPFKNGDLVELTNTIGIVEKINIFSTTLRSG